MKKKDNITFLCELPPPYGGVTVKNKLILDAISKENTMIEVIDFFDCKRKKWLIPVVFAKMIVAFGKKNKIIYGFGSYKRLKVALIFQSIFGGKKSLNRTINLVMGGFFHKEISAGSRYAKICGELKVNYVESERMVETLKQKGIANAEYFPNPRSEKGCRAPREVQLGKIKCVFFSQISSMKGVREIMSMCELLTEEERKCITVDFYGHIVDEIKNDFLKFEKKYDNVKYCGIFDSVKNNVYDKLNEYDILLFPTSWKGEGVPGILVEAKMSGICPIVSDWLYNTEIVIDGKEGVAIEGNYHAEMLRIIRTFLYNPQRLVDLKNGSFESRKRYALEQHIDDVMRIIKM